MCRFALRRFWDFVGAGIADAEALALLAGTLFADARNWRMLVEADETIAALPALSGFSLIEREGEKLLRRYE